MVDTKRNRKRSLFRAGMALFLLCIVLSIACAQEQPSNVDTIDPLVYDNISTVNISTVNISTATPMISTTVVGLTIAALFFIFTGLVVIGYLAKERGRLDMGEMRRAIAGLFVFGYTILVFLCLAYDICQSEVILAYIELVGIIIGFYFGTRTAAEKRAEAAAKISIEHVRFNPKEIAITVRNGGDSEIKVDKIYINDDAYEKDDKVDSQKSKEIKQDHPWKPKTDYKIKIAITEGLTAELTKESPP